MTLDQAKEALAAVLSEYWKGTVERLTDEDAVALADLAQAEIRFGVLAAQGDARAENLRAHVHAQLVALIATQAVIEARELDMMLRRVLQVGREVLVQGLQIVARAALAA